MHSLAIHMMPYVSDRYSAPAFTGTLVPYAKWLVVSKFVY